jgi:DNA (cytosine-5)-methyltransferase 1
MDLGFRQKGFRPVLALDDNQAAVETYNFNDSRGIALNCNLSELSGPELVALVRAVSPDQPPRGVVGGPPCQSFSPGNRQKKRRDPRARLGLDFARLVQALNEEFRLDFFVFENVAGLRWAAHSHRFRRIVAGLRRAGFHVFQGELDAGNFGVAQNRRRLLLVGINKEIYPWANYQFPAPLSNRTPSVWTALAGLPNPTFYRRDLAPEDIEFHPNHWTMNPRSAKFQSRIHGEGRSFRRLKWGKPSFTVAYGNREVHVHPNGRRRLSVFEAMRLQGFPESYVLRGTLSDQISQVSDAVPPPLAAALAESIDRTIYEPVKWLQRSLLRWFQRHQRSFPWRKTRKPFSVLLAEKLLQQTAATEKVVEAYNTLVRRFPTPFALASASKAELAAIISPLGFHYRGPELIRLARMIVRRHGGEVPADLKALLALSGVGDYCARAVLAFAYDLPVPVVDTNVARFLSRFWGLHSPLPANPARNRVLLSIAGRLVPLAQARDFNLAILDLCAECCTASRPACPRCPLRSRCAFANQEPAAPQRQEKTELAKVRK